MIIQWKNSSSLTVDSPTYYRDCEVPQCHYETMEIYVLSNGMYVLWGESNTIKTYGYIYKNDFNPLKPKENLLSQHDGSCNDGQFKLFVDLEINIRYVLVVTTHHSEETGNFSVVISGPDNVIVNHISKYCHEFCLEYVIFWVNEMLFDQTMEDNRCIVSE